MIIGVPSEVKTDEWRVALTPAGARGRPSAGPTGCVPKGGGGGAGVAHAGRRARAHLGRPYGLRPEGGGRRLVNVRRRVRPDRGEDPRDRRGGVGRGRPGLQG